MKDKESTRLMNLAKAIVTKNKVNARRICLNQVKSVFKLGKKMVWEVWHQQLVKPDKKPIEITTYGGPYLITPSEREFITMLINGMDDLEFNQLKQLFKKKMDELEYEYQSNRLSYILMSYIGELKQSSKEKPSRKRRRTLLDDTPSRTEPATAKT